MSKRTPKIRWEQIDKIAKAHHVEEIFSSYDALLRRLQFWWCQKYNRPIKDPLLQEYTGDELLYEFLRHLYTDPDNDPLKKLEEEAREADDMEWAKQQVMRAQKLSNKKPIKKPKPKKKVSKEPEFTPISTKFE